MKEKKRKVNKPVISGRGDEAQPGGVHTLPENEDGRPSDSCDPTEDDARPHSQDDDNRSGSRYDEESDRPLGSGPHSGGAPPPAPWR